jgi:hypothetical protein
MAIVCRVETAKTKFWCLDLAGGMPGKKSPYSDEGTHVVAYPHHGKRNQQWKFESHPNGGFYIVNQDNYMVLRESSRKHNGDGWEVHLVPKDSTKDYCQWEKKAVGDSFKIINKSSGLALDFSCTPGNEHRFITWPPGGGRNQLFWHAKVVPDRGWNLLCIGSAGEGAGGQAKTKAGPGWLSTRADLDDCEQWFRDTFRSGSKIWGVLDNRGQTFTPGQIKNAVRRFFDDCKHNDLGPLIYYTGHGYQGTGDWAVNGSFCFSDLESIMASHPPGLVPVIYSDCCYSGNWVKKAVSSSKKMVVVAASYSDRTVRDRRFAKAVFKQHREDIVDAQASISDQSWCIATNRDGSDWSWHKGQFTCAPMNVTFC